MAAHKNVIEDSIKPCLICNSPTGLNRSAIKPWTVLNMRKAFAKFSAAAGMLGFLGMSACSTSMEANRPVPVNLAQFHPGDSRFNVVSVAGAPEGSINDTAGPCDIYQLYTTGMGGFGKGMLTAGETITDIGTLGLAEIIWTPVQAGTRPRQHTVMFCYDHNEHLISVLNRDPSKNNSSKFAATPEVVEQSSAPAASNAPAVASATQPSATPTATAASPVQASSAQAGDLSKELPAAGAFSAEPQTTSKLETTAPGT